VRGKRKEGKGKDETRTGKEERGREKEQRGNDKPRECERIVMTWHATIRRPRIDLRNITQNRGPGPTAYKLLTYLTPYATPAPLTSPTVYCKP
jgi:hypothetical protein